MLILVPCGLIALCNILMELLPPSGCQSAHAPLCKLAALGAQTAWRVPSLPPQSALTPAAVQQLAVSLVPSVVKLDSGVTTIVCLLAVL